MSVTIWIPEVLAALCALSGWMVAAHRDDQGQPRKHRVRAGTVLAAVGLLLGLLLMPSGMTWRTFTLTVLVVLVVGLLLLRGAAVNSRGWTSTGEVVTSAVGLALSLSWWHRLALAGTTVAGLGLGAWTEGHGQPGAALLAAAVVLAPVRLTLSAGRRLERNRTKVEVAAAGLLVGAEWDAGTANQRGAPVKVRFDADQMPSKVTARLPPNWKAEQTDGLRAEVRERLDAFGRPWVFTVDSTHRRWVAEKAEPLPKRIIFDANEVDRVLAQAPSPLAFYLGTAQTAEGRLVPAWWDPDAADPHCLLGGRTKSGKTSVEVLWIAQALARGWDIIIFDPKGRDFAWAARLPGVRLFTGDDSPLGVDEAVAEMRSRAEWASKHVWSGKKGADLDIDLLTIPGQPFKPCLVVGDEIAMLASMGDQERQKLTEQELGEIARASRAQAMVCVLATQRPDAKFLPGEIKGNLGTRIMVLSDGDNVMTGMILDRAAKNLGKLSARPRGRGRLLVNGEGAVGDGEPVEYQGAYLDVRSIQARYRILGVDELCPVRFVEEPAWRAQLRAAQGIGQSDEPTGPLDGPGEPTGPSGEQPEQPEPVGGQSKAEQARRDQVFGLVPKEQQPGSQDSTSGLSDDAWALFSAEPPEPGQRKPGPDESIERTAELAEPGRPEPVDQKQPVLPAPAAELPGPEQAGLPKPAAETAELDEPTTVELAKPGPTELDESEWKFLDDPDEDPDPG